MISTHTRKLLLLLAITIGLVLLLNQTSDIVTSNAIDDNQDRKRESFIEGAKIMNFDGKGQSVFELEAFNATQYTDSSKVEIDTPKIVLRRDPETYQVTAKNAFYDLTNKKILLTGDVKLHNLMNPQHQPQIQLDLKTEALDVDLESLSISTDKAISIKYGPHTVRSTGFSASLEDEKLKQRSKIKFHSRVKGYYATSNAIANPS